MDYVSRKTKANWTWTDYGDFMDVMPIADSKTHVAGDECWCEPRRIDISGGLPDLMFSHNALDGRE